VPQPDRSASSPVAAPRADPHGDFEDFYRAHYTKLIKIALALGATRHEADELVDQTMEEMVRRWEDVEMPLAYARRAVGTNLIKSRQRERDGRLRMIQAFRLDPGPTDENQLNLWEDREWVLQLLESLPPAQREVMALVIDGLKPIEIAELLGKTPATIRKNLEFARRRLENTQGLPNMHEQGTGAPATNTSAPAARKEAR
jgi:RNA polymerase sigma factor (sigma-70 family)